MSSAHEESATKNDPPLCKGGGKEATTAEGERKHIRPRIKSRKAAGTPVATTSSSSLPSPSAPVDMKTTANHHQPPQPQIVNKPDPLIRGILKARPRYTSKSLVDAAAATAAQAASQEPTRDMSLLPSLPLPLRSAAGGDDKGYSEKNVSVQVQQSGQVMERKVQPRRKSNSNNNNNSNNNIRAPTAVATNGKAIEGYVPHQSKNPKPQHQTTIAPPWSPSFSSGQNNTNNSRDEPKVTTTTTTITTGDGKKKNDCDVLVFNSLAELMDKAGFLPDPKNVLPSWDQEGTMIEAELKFCVMSPEEFAETMQAQDDGQADAISEEEEEDDCHNHKKGGPVEEDDDDDDEKTADKENSDVEDGADSFLDLMDDADDDEPVETRPERAFLQLWKALSQWVTPEAVDHVLAFQQSWTDADTASSSSSPPSPPFPMSHHEWSDVESTRCAGLMSLLQLYLASCLQDDLHRQLEERRTVEQRLGNLIRCFTYARPSPKLGASQARALTCILVQTLFPEYRLVAKARDDSATGVTTNRASSNDDTKIPPSCRAVGLTMDEYNYLVHSAIRTFQTSAAATVQNS